MLAADSVAVDFGQVFENTQIALPDHLADGAVGVEEDLEPEVATEVLVVGAWAG